MKHTRLQDKEIKALRKDMMSLTKATLHDLKAIKEDIRNHAKLINILTNTTHELIHGITINTLAIADTRRAVLFTNQYFGALHTKVEIWIYSEI